MSLTALFTDLDPQSTLHNTRNNICCKNCHHNWNIMEHHWYSFSKLASTSSNTCRGITRSKSRRSKYLYWLSKGGIFAWLLNGDQQVWTKKGPLGAGQTGKNLYRFRAHWRNTKLICEYHVVDPKRVWSKESLICMFRKPGVSRGSVCHHHPGSSQNWRPLRQGWTGQTLWSLTIQVISEI